MAFWEILRISLFYLMFDYDPMLRGCVHRAGQGQDLLHLPPAPDLRASGWRAERTHYDTRLDQIFPHFFFSIAGYHLPVFAIARVNGFLFMILLVLRSCLLWICRGRFKLTTSHFIPMIISGGT